MLAVPVAGLLQAIVFCSYHLTRMAPAGPNELRPPVWECYGTFEIVSEGNMLLSIFKRVTPAKGSFWAYREPRRYAEAP